MLAGAKDQKLTHLHILVLCGGGGGGPEHDPLSRGTLLGLLAVVVVVEVAEVGEGGRAGAEVGRVGGRPLRAERLDGVVVIALQRLLVILVLRGRRRRRRVAYRRGIGIVSLALVLRGLFRY